jgi:hypothetical protein
MPTSWLDVSATDPHIAYTANGSQTAFTVPFLFFANSDLKVYLNGVLQTIGAHYTVAGALDPLGGTVTFLVAPAGGTTVLIVRDLPLALTTHVPLSGPLDIAGLNFQFSRLVAMIQQVEDVFGVAVALGNNSALASGVVNDSTVPGASVKDALNSFLTGGVNSLVVGGTAVAPSLTVVPTGNPTSTKTILSVTGQTGAAATREFLVNLGLVSNDGSGVGTPDGDKVTLYSGVVAESGTGSVWAANFLVNQAATSGSYSAQGIEIDIDNLNAHRGDTAGLGGLSPPTTYGLVVSGASTFRITAALGVFSGNKMFNRGLVFALDSIDQATIQDLTSSVISYDVRGSHTYGVDFVNGTFSGAPIRLANNTHVKWRNAGNSADVSAIKLNASDALEFGANVGVGGAPASRFHVMDDQDAATVTVRVHNTGDGNVTTKLAALNFYGRDTVAADKEAVRLEVVPDDANWVGGHLRIYARTGDAIAETARITSAAINLATGKVLQVAGTQVVSSRVTGYTAFTGTNTNRGTAYDTATITLVQLAERVRALQVDLTAHGLIGA